MEEEAPVSVPIAAVPSSGGSAGGQLIKQLASCNKQTRDKALKVIIKTWLPSQNPGEISDDEMKKLWKGLFYCVWHADKAPVQAELFDRLSSLLVTLPLPLSLHYLSVFLLTIRREWTGIDNLRLDKFYLLIRRFIHSLFLMLKKNYSWDLDVTRQFIAVFEEKTFFPDDKFLANGVNYHIASVFLEELVFFLPLRAEILDVLLKPFLCVMSKCHDKVLVGKVKSNIFDVLLKMGRDLIEMRKLGDESAVDDGLVLLGAIGVTMGFSAKFYEFAASPNCLQGNRKVLLKLYEDFLRLEKDLASSGLEISVPDALVDEEEEVPKLISICKETEENGGTSDKPLKKKNKKAKKGEVADKVNKKPKNKSENKQNMVVADEDITSIENTSDEPELILNESIILNLQKQFEKVAAEVAMENGGSVSCDSAEGTIRASGPKKRKRGKNANGEDKISIEEGDTNVGEKSSEKSAKKVRFSMKSNLVWKPHSPMPPQSLRLPPSVTPRGSALKKGVPPGPIREMPPATKKVKVKRKKGRKVSKVISPAIKRLRKLQTVSI